MISPALLAPLRTIAQAQADIEARTQADPCWRWLEWRRRNPLVVARADDRGYEEHQR